MNTITPDQVSLLTFLLRVFGGSSQLLSLEQISPFDSSLKP
jgi:hypothetical protein